MANIAALRAARDLLEMPLLDLWIAYFSIGGNLDAAQLRSYLDSGHPPIPTGDHDAIVHALNETFADRGHDHPLRYGTT